MQATVHLVSEEPLENILMEYEKVFQGIGCLPGEYELEVDPTVTSVQVRPRKIPLSMKADVKAKIDSLEEKGIIEKVDNPTLWISHLQPVRKPNGTVRLCLDPQNLNQALKRNHFQMPDIEDVLPQLAEAKVFSLCDAKDGFLQVKLSGHRTGNTVPVDVYHPTASLPPQANPVEVNHQSFNNDP